MARIVIIAILGALMLAGMFGVPQAKAAPSFEFGPGGFSFWFEDDADRYRNRRGRKCRDHRHRGWSYGYRHFHCIPKHRSWGSHKRRGHR